MPSSNDDSYTSSGMILLPQKIQLTQTILLSTCGSISLLSILYYLANRNQKGTSSPKVVRDDTHSTNTNLNDDYHYNLGIASPRQGDDWVSNTNLSKQSLGIFHNSLRRPIIHVKNGAKSAKKNLKVTFANVDTGWARFDEECPANSCELYRIEEDQMREESLIEI